MWGSKFSSPSGLFLAVGAAICMFAVSIVATGGPALGQDSGEARVHLLHGIPDVAVDIAAGGEVIIEGFEFSDTAVLDSFAGQTLTDLTVNVAGTEDAVLELGDVELPAEGSHTIVAHLTEDGDPTLTSFQNDLSAIPVGQGSVMARHTAAAGAVDVRANSEVLIDAISNTEEAGVSVEAGVASVDVVPTGTARPRLLGPIDVDITEGDLTTIYVVGPDEDGEVSALIEVFEGLQSTPTAVNTGASPVAGGAGQTGIIFVLVAAGISAVAVTRRLLNAS